MDHISYLKNYHSDLLRSQKTPLLIELNQDDMTLLTNNAKTDNAQLVPLKIAEQVYNHQGNKSNHMIVIDGDKACLSGSFVLLDVLVEALRDELKSIKNIATIKETLKTAISLGTGGLLNEFAGDYLDKGFDFILDEVGDQFSDLLTDITVDNIDISNVLLSSIEGLLSDTAGDQLGDLAGHINEQTLSLSTSAKVELDKLSNTFSKTQNIDVFQLSFKLLLAIGLDTPKLIYINNPHKLDDDSIGLLSLLFSFAKNQKDREKHIGLSVVYTYTDTQFHLYNSVDESLLSKQRLLMAQRRFVQRYAMLEKPGTDIPTVAVKSSLFIGRTKELETLNNQFLNRQSTTLSVISGEPGIGKTALVNEHLTLIQKQQDIIQLTLLNEVGHSSTNTGLSSLEKSILDEAKRLELMIGWKDKGTNYLKNIGTKENAFKAIGLIFSGADKALGIADAGYQRVKIDDNVDGLKQIGMEDLNDKQGDNKQQQFDNLDKAINRLQSVSSRYFPLVLFIDDMQWIDNTASEYILTRLINRDDLYIVTTIRQSDASTALKEQLQRPSLYEYSIALLKICGVKGAESYYQDIYESDIKTYITSLSGFNNLVLTELISKVIKGSPRKCEALAKAVFTALAGEGEDNINTLFAIETLNMLCDKKLYSENNFERLILDSPLRFNSELKDIDSTLSQTFSTLQIKYKDSLAHANESGSGSRFNLMAYAVLEERLHLLKIHFGKQGNAAVNSLLFSSLLGAPFSSELVKRIVLTVVNTKDPILVPLKLYLLGTEEQTHLLPEHYSIIDEVYEILRRMTVSGDRYKYRHGLLHTFLDKQFDYLLSSIFKKNLIQAKDRLFDLIHWEIKDISLSIKNELRSDPEEMNKTQMLHSTYGAWINVLDKAFFSNPNEDWASTYINGLERVQKFHIENNNILGAIQLAEKIHSVCEYTDPDERYELIFENLPILINLYETTNRIDEVIVLYIELLKYHDAWTTYSDLDRSEILSGLANAYLKVNRSEEAVSQFEEIMAAEDPTSERNIDTLRCVARCYAQIKRDDDAIALAEEVVIRSGMTIDHVLLSHCYAQNNQINDALTLAQFSLNSCRSSYHKMPDKYVEEYLQRLGAVAFCYQRANQPNQVVEVEEEALPIIKEYYAKAPEVWVSYYITTINNLAKSHCQLHQIEQALSYAETSIALIKPYYIKNPAYWAKHHALSLLNLATTYQQKKFTSEALAFAEKARLICNKYHALAPAYWTEPYFDCLSFLGRIYRDEELQNKASTIDNEMLLLGKNNSPFLPKTTTIEIDDKRSTFASFFKVNKSCSDEVPFREKCVSLIEGFYKNNKSKWHPHHRDEQYGEELRKLAECYKASNRLNEAIVCEEKQLSIYSPERIKLLRLDREVKEKEIEFIAYYAEYFAQHYFNVSAHLTDSYTRNEQVEDSIELQVSVLDLSIKCFVEDADKWAKTSMTSMNRLIQCYLDNQQFSNAAELEQRAIDLYESLYELASERWFESFMVCIHGLATAYYKNNQLPNAIRVLEHGLKISELDYIKRPFVCRDNHLVLLRTLLAFYKENQQIIEPFLLQEKILTIDEDDYAKTTDITNYKEAITLQIQAANGSDELDTLWDANAVSFAEKSATLLYTYYCDLPTAWAYDYCECLTKLATFYHLAGDLHKALETQSIALSISKDYFKDKPQVWAENYTTCLTYLARYYQESEQENEAIRLTEKALVILEPLLEIKSTAFSIQYIEHSTRLINSYENNNQVKDALMLSLNQLHIMESLYQQAPDKWAEKYVRIALGLVSLYKRCDLFKDAFKLEGEILVVLERYYQPDETRPTYEYHPTTGKKVRESDSEISAALFWATSYKNVLDSLAVYSAGNNQLNSAINFSKKAIAVCISYRYSSKFKEKLDWTNGLKESLDVIIACYNKNNLVHEAIKVELDHLDVYYDIYSRTPDVGSEQYIERMHFLDDYCQSDLDLFQKQQVDVITFMLRAYESLYPTSPQKWRQGYLYTLNANASLYLAEGEKHYGSACSHFKQYFEVFSVEMLNELEQCLHFIRPFLSYVSTFNYVSDDELTHRYHNGESAVSSSTEAKSYFAKMVNDFHIAMTNKFSDGYAQFIDALLNSNEDIPPYMKPVDSYNNEKYQLFVKYFCEV